MDIGSQRMELEPLTLVESEDMSAGVAAARVSCKLLAEKVVPDEHGNMVKTGEYEESEWEPQGAEADFVRALLVSQGIQPPQE